MNYKDLMPDDLINTETDGYVRVTFSTPTSVVYPGGICSIKQASPIPLTGEILVKNGFVVESCGCVWYQEQGIQEQNYLIVGFRKNGEPRRIEVFFVNKIKAEIRDIYYVHQLQHLLRLCGIAKEIEL